MPILLHKDPCPECASGDRALKEVQEVVPVFWAALTFTMAAACTRPDVCAVNVWLSSSPLVVSDTALPVPEEG